MKKKSNLRAMPPPLVDNLETIPGSKYFRATCSECGELIRTNGSPPILCSGCHPLYRGVPGRKHIPPDIEWGGYCDKPIMDE